MLDRIEQLEYDLSMLADMAPAGAVNYIRKAIGYDDYIREYAQERRLKPEEFFEVLDALQESAGGFKTWDAWSAHMEEYKEELLRQAADREARGEGVSLMTMHSSKGLEFKVVYILDANEGVTPHHKAVLDADLEEERRMFYVAMTRAKDRLHIFYVTRGFIKSRLYRGLWRKQGFWNTHSETRREAEKERNQKRGFEWKTKMREPV